MQNQGKTKFIAVAVVEGKRNKGRPSKRWRDEAEEDLNVLGIRKCVILVVCTKLENGM